MFKRLLATILMLSISILFPGGLMPVGAIASGNKRPDKKSSCATCPANSPDSQTDSASKLATLGRRTQMSPFVPLKSSLFEGVSVNFVNTATGRLSFAVTDLNVPGAVPLVFQRTYISDRREDVGLGMGWSFTFNDQIKIAGDTATLMDSAGSVMTFHRDGQSQTFRAMADDPGIHQQFELSGTDTIIERAALFTHIYTKINEAYRLSQVTGPQAINITITYDQRGNITRIANNPGGTIRLQWSDERDARLLSVSDSSGSQVFFHQDGRRLRAVTDQANAQWTYDYTGGQLRVAADPLGHTLLRVRYNKGRACY